MAKLLSDSRKEENQQGDAFSHVGVMHQEKEGLGMHLRKIVAIPSGNLQSGQKVRKWDSTRTLKQLHLGTNGAKCGCLKGEGFAEKGWLLILTRYQPFTRLTLLKPLFPPTPLHATDLVPSL